MWRRGSQKETTAVFFREMHKLRLAHMSCFGSFEHQVEGFRYGGERMIDINLYRDPTLKITKSEHIIAPNCRIAPKEIIRSTFRALT